jgi:hypothetical protein
MGCTKGSIVRKDTVEAEAWRRQRMMMQINSIGRMSASVCTVCYIDRTLYLRVSPAEPVWVTEDTEAIFEVQSNTSWNID